MRILVAVLVLTACGGGGATPDATPDDADPGVLVDAGPSCGVTWDLRYADATALTLLDAEPGDAGRTVRVGVSIEVSSCDQLAIPTLGYVLDVAAIEIGPRVWHASGVACTDVHTVVRPVVLEDLHADTWLISASDLPPLTVVVGDSPPSCDTSRTECLLDCDCDEAAGERCLSFGSLGGPTSACGVPCEDDRDCGGGTCTTDIADGLGYACSPGPQCGGGDPCPTGWTCEAGACTPDFTLNNGTRHVCDCDADCDAGLHCVTAMVPGGARRCEALCQTAGAWCEGAHVCGGTWEDASGLAATESVCVWLGE